MQSSACFWITIRLLKQYNLLSRKFERVEGDLCSSKRNSFHKFSDQVYKSLGYTGISNYVIKPWDMFEPVSSLKVYFLRNLQNSKLSSMCIYRGAWRAAAHGVTKSQTRLSDWTDLTSLMLPFVNLKALQDIRWCWLQLLVLVFNGRWKLQVFFLFSIPLSS